MIKTILTNIAGFFAATWHLLTAILIAGILIWVFSSPSSFTCGVTYRVELLERVAALDIDDDPELMLLRNDIIFELLKCEAE